MSKFKGVSPILNVLLVICLMLLLFQIESNKLTGAATTIDGQVSVEVGTACGDNIAAGTEICDGTDINEQTCLTRGSDGGTLSCSSNCLSYNTSACTNITDEEIIQVRGGGVAPKLIFNVDTTAKFDAAISKTMMVYVIFKEETYLFSLEEREENYAFFRLKYPEQANLPISYYKIAKDQTRTIDLNEDGTPDLYLTLTDILTRRAAFHLERFKPLIVGAPKPQLVHKQNLEIAIKNTVLAPYLIILIVIIIFIIIFKKN